MKYTFVAEVKTVVYTTVEADTVEEAVKIALGRPPMEPCDVCSSAHNANNTWSIGEIDDCQINESELVDLHCDDATSIYNKARALWEEGQQS
jgi:hypothetical protein